MAQHRGLAAELPGLAARAASAEEANAILRMAMAYPTVAPGAFEAALARGGTARPEALAIASERVSDLRSAFERVLASDASPPARAAAARALGRALPASLPSLVQALEAEKDPLVRAAVAAALAQGGPDAVPALAKAAQSDAAAAPRLAAVDALGQVGGAAAAASLLNLLADEADEVALAALRALEAIGYRGTDRRLLRVLSSATSAGRTEAARLLARSGAPEGGEAVLAAAKAAPTGELVDLLRPFRTRGVPTAMAGWLQHSDPAVRLAAAEYMASVQDARAPAVLRGLLEADMPAAVADRAAASLIALRDVAAVPRLLALLDAGRLTPATRRALVQAAGRLGWQQAGAAIVAILWRGVADPAVLRQAEERQLWIDAVEAAATVGPVWSAVVESAVGPMPAESLYEAALTALRVEGVAGFLAALWHSPLPDDLRRHTVVPYARLRGAAAAPRLIELLESPVLQGPAMRALAELGGVDALVDALRRKSAITRAAAAAALGAAGEPRAVPPLEPLLHDDDPFVRAEAAWALAALTRRPVVYTDHLGEPRHAVPPNQAQ